MVDKAEKTKICGNGTKERMNHMSRLIGTFLGKSILLAERVLHKDGSTFPGKFVIKLFPKYLSKLKYPKDVIMVTGSSGKGSTTKIIANMLRNCGKTVCHNLEGSNMIRGIASTMLKHVTWGGKIPEDVIVLEVDERYLKEVTKYITPSLIVLNNLTRDQPPRQGNYDLVYREIEKGITDSAELLCNGDDPITRQVVLKHPEKFHSFGINRLDTDFDDLPTAVKDCAYCPKCGKRMNYGWYHYGTVGDFSCPSCGYSRGTVDYAVTAADTKAGTVTLNEKLKICVNPPLLFHMYNLAAAYGVADLMQLSPEKVAESLNVEVISEKIYNRLEKKGRTFVYISCKAENNATYNLAHYYTLKQPGEKVLVMGLREISRRYSHFDLSWIYDLDMEALNVPEVQEVICAGPYAADFALRCKLAGFAPEKIKTMETLEGLAKELKRTTGDVYGILNFDYIPPFLEEVNQYK